jgi:hypothetical protein
MATEAHRREAFLDKVRPPVVQVARLVTDAEYDAF